MKIIVPASYFADGPNTIRATITGAGHVLGESAAVDILSIRRPATRPLDLP